MAVKSIKLEAEIDRTPEQYRKNGELDQGDTWSNQRIYKLVNDDGSEQFFALDLEFDSYGSASSVNRLVKLVHPATKTVTVWE